MKTRFASSAKNAARRKSSGASGGIGGAESGTEDKRGKLAHDLVRREVELLEKAFGIRLHLQSCGERFDPRLDSCGISRGVQQNAPWGEAAAARAQCRRFHEDLNKLAGTRREPVGCRCPFGLQTQVWPVLCHGVPAAELWVGGIDCGQADGGQAGEVDPAGHGHSSCAGLPQFAPEQWECIVQLIQRTAEGLGRILETMGDDRLLAPEEKTMAWLQENAFRPLRAGEIASHAAVSPQHLSRLWQRRYGETIGDSIARIRVQKAMRWLQAGPERKIIDIANDCGFGSLSQFNRVFLNVTGMTPTEARKRR